MSVVNGINKLAPGHYIIIEKENVINKQYRDISFTKNNTSPNWLFA